MSSSVDVKSTKKPYHPTKNMPSTGQNSQSVLLDVRIKKEQIRPHLLDGLSATTPCGLAIPAGNTSQQMLKKPP